MNDKKSMWNEAINLLYIGRFEEMFELVHRLEMLEQQVNVDNY